MQNKLAFLIAVKHLLLLLSLVVSVNVVVAFCGPLEGVQTIKRHHAQQQRTCQPGKGVDTLLLVVTQLAGVHVSEPGRKLAHKEGASSTT